MKPVSVNEPAALIVRATEIDYKSLTEAVRHAVEEADESDRARMVLVTESGKKFHWPEISKMYQEHLQGP